MSLAKHLDLDEQQQREIAGQQVQTAGQQVTEVESLLVRYRERFGDLPED